MAIVDFFIIVTLHRFAANADRHFENVFALHEAGRILNKREWDSNLHVERRLRLPRAYFICVSWLPSVGESRRRLPPLSFLGPHAFNAPLAEWMDRS
jgi:hypothetical protein